jgi:DNA-binding SARP family transcriptional activator/RecA/RadA recombinase
MPHLSLSLLGPFQATLDGQPITSFKSNKVRALLAYLAVEADRPHPREVLAGLLWPDWTDREALGNLRYALSDLRRVTGDRTAEPPFLLIARDTLQFNTASDFSLDLRSFTDLAETALTRPEGDEGLSELEEAICLYQGSFLEGFSLPDAAPFEEWALLTRERLARQMSSTLRHLAAAYEERGQYQRAQSFARRQLELDPWDELAHRRLVRSLALSGQRSAALAQYETCRRILAEELGVEPDQETTQLYQQISDGKLRAPTRPISSIHVAGEPPPFLREKVVGVERPIFVAREREVEQLGSFLELALAGQGRVLFVTGEAGSGKTALIQEFVRRAQQAHDDVAAASGNCNAHTGVGDPYLPFREILGLLTGDVEARWAAGALSRAHTLRLWNTLPLAAQALVSVGPDLIDTFVPGATLVERSSAQAPVGATWLTQVQALVQRKQMGPAAPLLQQSGLLDQYAKVLQVLARQVPLLLVVDDLQWADLGSVSLLFHLGRELAGSRILILGAYRPEEIAIGRDGERHPLQPVVNELQREFGEIIVDMERAESQHFTDAFLDSEPNRLGTDFRERLYRQTGGHPLFTIELLRGMQERGDLVQDPHGRWVEGPALNWETLPARVEAACAERIGRLPQPLQDVLRVASVQGEDFTAEVVSRVLGPDERETVQQLSNELDRRHRLVRAQAIHRLGSRRLSRYRFRHDLFQKYLYDQLDRVERAYLHEDVGKALEELYADDASEIAVQLAWHFEEAGTSHKAIHYLYLAGQRAVQLSAYEEGIAHLTRGLGLLTTLPDSPQRTELELSLQMALGIAWQGITGLQTLEAKDIYIRARELSQQVGRTSQLCQVLVNLSIHHYMRAEYHLASDLAQEALDLAGQSGDQLLVALSHWFLGIISFSLGEYAQARSHLGQIISFYDPQRHHQPFVILRGSDPGPSALAWDACCLWCLGYPEQAARRSQEALALAGELDHPFTLADALTFGGCAFNAMRRDALSLKDDAEMLMRLSREKLPSWVCTAECYTGEALAMLGQVSEGITQIHQGMSSKEALGMRCYRVGMLRALADAQAIAGRPEEGLATLDEALTLVEQTDERHWEAELRRLKADLLLSRGETDHAEASLREAIEVARRQQAKSWELRATVSLSRLLQMQGRQEEARQLLSEIYGRFTEGVDTPDLQEARALLQKL